MDELKKRLANLLAVKSIVTVILTAVFAYLSVAGQVTTDQFLTVFTVVIAFYFGTQAEKRGQGAAEVMTGTLILPEAVAEQQGGDAGGDGAGSH